MKEETPRTDEEWYNYPMSADCHGENYNVVRLKYARQLERENKELLEALDTLSLVIGLTPIAGNKEALQEALNLARTTIAKARLLR